MMGSINIYCAAINRINQQKMNEKKLPRQGNPAASIFVPIHGLTSVIMWLY